MGAMRMSDAPNRRKLFTIHCDSCGGQNVRADASAEWNVDRQIWEMVTFYDNTDCDDCEAQCRTIMKPLVMSIETIQSAVNADLPVRWSNDGYHVIRSGNEYLIKFQPNGSCVGLTNRAGDCLNGTPDEFYIKETTQ